MTATEIAQARAAAEGFAAGPSPTATPAATPASPGTEPTAGADLGGLAAEPTCPTGYGYGCSDDPLSTGALDEGFRVRPGPVRTTKIRPTAEELRKEELRKRFLVGEGGKLPNAVSEEEFEKIARLYEHIWDGDQNLSIDTAGMAAGEGEKYKATVMEQIARLLQTPTGRKQLQYLTYGYKRDGKEKDLKTVIKAGADRNRDGSRLDDYWAQADPADTAASSMDFDEVDGKKVLRGLGAGSNSTVLFNMPEWKEKGSMRADVVLAHELTHALTQIMGAEDTTIVGFEDGIRADVSGSKPLMRTEHQATGLARYANGPLGKLNVNERQYILERNAIGQGKGVNGTGEVLPGWASWGNHAISGDDELRPRASYRDEHGH